MNSELENELAEAAPLMLVPRLAAIQHDRLMQEDYRRRLHDGHEAMMLATGMTASPMTREEEMGDINVGVHKHFYDASQAAVKQEVPPVSANNGSVKPRPSVSRATKDQINDYIKRKIAEGLAKSQPTPQVQTTADATADPWYKRFAIPLAIAAGTLGGGGGLTAYQLLTRPAAPTPVVATPAQPQTQYDFKISSKPGHGITAE